MHRLLLRYLACVLWIATAFSAFGQNARFSGQVTDPQGAAIPDAKIQIINKDTLSSIETKTDASGSYVAPYLPAGRYRIVVQATVLINLSMTTSV
jgi:hypothetical protein